MGDDWELQSFQSLREEHFVPLCRKLGLSTEPVDIGVRYAVVSAAAGNVRVFFEHERGLCSFSVGASTDVKPLCSVDEIARRFPRIRLVQEGLQRLNLEEQSSFVEGRWSALQVMFAPEHLGATRKWHDAVVGEITRRYSRDS
jgi:hypothetical protein